MSYNVTANSFEALIAFVLPNLIAKCRWEDGCLVWTGNTSGTNGYGLIQLIEHGRRRSYTVHRLSWEIANGERLGNRHVLHACDNPPCFNPFHLIAGSHKDNMVDAALKERMAHGNGLPQSKLSQSKIEHARQMLAEGFSQTATAKSLHVAQSTMSRALNGLTWFHSTN